MPLIAKGDGRQAFQFPIVAGYTVAQSPAAHSHAIDLPLLVAGDGVTFSNDSGGGVIISTNDVPWRYGMEVLTTAMNDWKDHTTSLLADMKEDIATLIERLDEWERE